MFEKQVVIDSVEDGGRKLENSVEFAGGREKGIKFAILLELEE